ncbi:MAG: hypothetical protein K0S61_2456 [Anaerocolumna sp.]|jgi:Ser/Thr protein kinase RdoA (MazF antagonist)|nr:hypothetical protein [Anaerocolumna sp.]
MDYIEYAKKTLSLYPITYQDITFIRHNENIVFKISDSIQMKAYVLRIHKSKVEGLATIGHTYEGLKSEMEFLNHLSCNPLLMVQKPIENNYGKFVTVHEQGESAPAYYATLLEWIDGSQLTLKEDNIEELVYTYGKKVAILQETSKRFKPQGDFVRPIYSVESLEAALKDLRYGIEVDLFNNYQYELMVKVGNKVIDKIKELDKNKDTWGIIHADFQLGNIIIKDNEVGFIDFGLSGHGYYLFDLGSAITILERPLRDIFLKGYSSIIPYKLEDIHYVECLIFADIFISYMLFIYDENGRGWIKGHADNMCTNYFEKFLAEEEIFYSL